jgi:hypothetical protein
VQHSGTAQAGAATTVTLAAGASATDDLFNGQVVKIYGGTGAGQSRVITDYVGSTKVATVDRAWATNPDATSTYAVMASSAPKLDASHQVVAASVQGNVTGSAGSVTGSVGSVTGAVGSVTADVGITQAGADKAWATAARALTAAVTVGTNNDKTGYGLSAAAVQAVWDALTSALTTASSIGKLLVDNINATIGSRAVPGDAMALTSAERNSTADALLDRANGVEPSWTVRQALRIMFSALGGKLAGAATTTVTTRNQGDTLNRITATVDADGNRTAVTLDAS